MSVLVVLALILLAFIVGVLVGARHTQRRYRQRLLQHR